MEEDDRAGETPCFGERVVGGYVVDAEAWRDVARFRAAERERLYALRRTMPLDERAAETERVISALEAMIGDLQKRIIAAYWPIRGELDLRPWMTAISERGAIVALPVVVQPKQPVEFHRWTPRCAMARGAWNIPVPADPSPCTPDTVIVPLVGVDGECFRLGNGGGYYDMTLTALTPAPRTIAVGQGFCRMPTIYPQPWDVRMGSVILGDGTVLGGEMRNQAR